MAYRIALILASAAAGIAWPQTPQGGFEGPGRYIIASAGTHQMLTPKTLELDKLDHRTVILSSPRDSDNQRWDFESAGSEWFYIRNAMDGRALESSGVNGIDCARFDGGMKQQWRIQTSKENTISIVSRDGRALDLPEGPTINGAHIGIAEWTGDAGQRFTLRRVSRRH